MTFSFSAASPLYPSLMPRLVDPLWFKSDVPQDENVELSKVEKEHSDWLKSIGEKEIGFPPIGKNGNDEETDEDEEEDDDNDNDDNDDSVSHDEEDDAEMDGMNLNWKSLSNSIKYISPDYIDIEVHFLRKTRIWTKYYCWRAMFSGLSSLGVPGVPWHPQILADQLQL